MASPLSEFLGITAISAVLWFGGQMVLNQNSLDASAFIVYLGLAYNVLTPAKSLSRATYKVKKAIASAERIFNIIDSEEKIKEKIDPTIITDFKNQIKLIKVCI